MINTLFIAVASAAIAGASPVLAEGKSAEPATATVAAASQNDARAMNSKQRYCIVQDVTGSIMPVKTCRTREAWLSRGFDPLKK